VIVELRLDFLVSVVGGGFKNFRWEENFKNNFSRAGEVEALLQFLVCVLACANCKCAFTRTK
jgi:hypothetical protein